MLRVTVLTRVTVRTELQALKEEFTDTEEEFYFLAWRVKEHRKKLEEFEKMAPDAKAEIDPEIHKMAIKFLGERLEEVTKLRNELLDAMEKCPHTG